MAQRRRSAAAIEARVGEDALRGDGTVQQIAWRHGAHSNQASQRKRNASENLAESFERREKAGLEPQSRLLGAVPLGVGCPDRGSRRNRFSRGCAR